MNINRPTAIALAAAGLVFLGCSGAVTPNGAGSPPATLPPAEITLAEFDQISTGMTYEQVTTVVGSPGTVSSEMNTPGMASKSYKYDGGTVSTAIVTFSDGKVQTKTQFGLK